MPNSIEVVNANGDVVSVATNDAIVTSLGGIAATLTSQLNTLQAQLDIATSLWTDNSGAFYTRRDTIDQDSGVVTVTFTNPTGTIVTPGAGLKPASTNHEILQTKFVANTNGTGYSTGDSIIRFSIINDAVSPPTVAYSAWLNLITGSFISPTLSHLTDNTGSALPTGASTAELQNTIITHLNTLVNKANESVAIPVSNTASESLLQSLVTKANESTPIPVSFGAGESHIGNVSGESALIEVILTVTTSAHAAGDILADTQIVTNALRVADRTGILQSITVIDEDDVGAAFDIVFLSASNSLGTENEAPTISDTLARDILGFVSINIADYIDLGGCRIATKTGLGLIVKPASTTRNLYLAAITRGTPTYTGSGLRVKLGIILD